MASESHTQGRGFRRIAPTRRPDLRQVLDRQRQAEADNRRAVYVRPLGRGLHLVRNVCNDQEYRVGSGQGALTYKPGAQVLLGSHTGTAGEVILGLPGPTSGASGFALSASPRTAGYRVTPPAEPPPPGPSCPLPITGKSYLGIWVDFGAKELHPWLYLDGAYQGSAGPTVTYAGLLSTAQGFARVHSSGDVVIFKTRSSGQDNFVTWDVVAGTLSVLQTGLDPMGGPIWPGSGTTVYFQEAFSALGVSHLQLYAATVGASGVMNPLTAASGPEYQDLTDSLQVPSAIASTGIDVQVPSLWSGETGDGVAVPYAVPGGGWSAGQERVLVSGTSNAVEGPGHAVSGNRSARSTYFESFAVTIGLLPAGPGSPEVAVFSEADYGSILQAVGHLAPSPDKADLVCYPFELQSDGAEADKLFRFQVPAGGVIPGGCELPRITIEAGPEGVPTYMLPRT